MSRKLENSSELGEDMEREQRCVCRSGITEGLEVEERGDDDDGQTRGSSTSIKAAGMQSGLVGPGTPC